MDRNDRFSIFRYVFLYILRIDVQGRGVDIHENNLCPRHCDRLGCCDKRICCRYYLVTPTDAESFQGKENRIGTVADTDAMLRAAECCESLLEGPHIRPPDEGGTRENVCDRPVDLGLDAHVLCFQVYE